MTYTSIKNTTPVVKELVKALALKLKILDNNSNNNNGTNNDSNSKEDKNKSQKDETIRIFFPDMGAAVLARRDWKMNSPEAEVPLCLYTANIQNDPILDSDKLVILLCPQYSESDYLKRILDICTDFNIPIIMINPELINMDQGYGVRKFFMLYNTIYNIIIIITIIILY